MKAKLTINGKEFEVEISEEQAKALTETKKKTGYERVGRKEKYYYAAHNGKVEFFPDVYDESDNSLYNIVNYYSDKTVAENNARADRLYRQLRRFAVEHRKNKINWNNIRTNKWMIVYNHDVKILDCVYRSTVQCVGTIFFDTYETAQLAIKTFKDELIWYFTEYKDSL